MIFCGCWTSRWLGSSHLFCCRMVYLRLDDRRLLSGIVFVIRNGLRLRDASKDYGPYMTLYNSFMR